MFCDVPYVTYKNERSKKEKSVFVCTWFNTCRIGFLLWCTDKNNPAGGAV